MKSVGFIGIAEKKKSDKNNINICPGVRFKKNEMFSFFPVPHNGFHIIVKNHSKFQLFFPMSDETRELPYYNKQQTSMARSWPIKFHTAAKTGVKRKSNTDAQNKKK